MSEERFAFEPLGQQPNRAAFSCGQEELDRYLREQAGQEERRKVATCFVLVDREEDAIVGYYTLSAATLAATELPEDLAKRLPRYPNLPAILLGRFAVDSRYQNRGFARRLLVDALLRALGATAQVGAVAVIVDAKDEAAASFYEHYGFAPFRDLLLRLFLPMATIRQLVSGRS